MFDGGWVTPFDGMGFDDAEQWLEADRAARVAQEAKTRRAELLDVHIDRLWNGLPAQSRRRLGCIAVSAGTEVGGFQHGALIGALGLIAEAEGTFEEEAEFAETYLGTSHVCEAVAEAERERNGTAGSAGSAGTGRRDVPDSPAVLADLADLAVSDWAVPSGASREQTVERREQTRLAVARFRERQKKKLSVKSRKAEERAEERMLATSERRAIGIDGEGVTLPDGSHVYRYLAACLADGTVLGELYDEEGILTGDALDFLVRLPKYDGDGQPFLGIFGYGLGYDITKMLEGLSDSKLYKLLHAEELEGRIKSGPYRLSMLGKCFEVVDRKAAKGQMKTLTWDILKGFQSTFVKALESWEVGTKTQHERIAAMKKKRGDFVRESYESVTGYCKEECQLLAALVEKYVRAHAEAGIDLRGKYHGAGSTGDAFLTLMNALGKRCTREVEDEDFEAFQATRSAFSRSFFGGRAEISRLGIVQGPVWTADIASAYPHALFDLPCVWHGKWRLVSGRGVGRAIETARLACVHYRMLLDREHYSGSELRRGRLEKRRVVEQRPDRTKKEWKDLPEIDKRPGERETVMGIYGEVAELAWGPLPYRTEKGSIVFPAAHPGGWAWTPEYRIAKKHFDGVRAVEAWVLRSDCQCERPYRDIGMYYLRRLEWGGSKGKVLKLGMNSCYGKFAQVIGRNPKYSCRVVAGQITSTTRGRMVEGIASLDEPWNVIYAATDGLISTSELSPPDPPENETGPGAKEKGKAWLGSWEVEKHAESLFIVQPGFYFSLEPKGKARTRGTPLEVIDEYRNNIIEQWRTDATRKPKGLPLQDVFHGIKTSIRPPTSKDAKYRRKRCYGTWSKQERHINYVVNPKRSELVDQGDESYRLLTWWLAPDQAESAEYKKDPSFADVDHFKDDQPDFVEPLVRGVGGDD